MDLTSKKLGFYSSLENPTEYPRCWFQPFRSTFCVVQRSQRSPVPTSAVGRDAHVGRQQIGQQQLRLRRFQRRPEGWHRLQRQNVLRWWFLYSSFFPGWSFEIAKLTILAIIYYDTYRNAWFIYVYVSISLKHHNFSCKFLYNDLSYIYTHYIFYTIKRNKS